MYCAFSLTEKIAKCTVFTQDLKIKNRVKRIMTNKLNIVFTLQSIDLYHAKLVISIFVFHRKTPTRFKTSRLYGLGLFCFTLFMCYLIESTVGLYRYM